MHYQGRSIWKRQFFMLLKSSGTLWLNKSPEEKYRGEDISIDLHTAMSIWTTGCSSSCWVVRLHRLCQSFLLPASVSQYAHHYWVRRCRQTRKNTSLKWRTPINYKDSSDGDADSSIQWTSTLLDTHHHCWMLRKTARPPSDRGLCICRPTQRLTTAGSCFPYPHTQLLLPLTVLQKLQEFSYA